DDLHHVISLAEENSMDSPIFYALRAKLHISKKRAEEAVGVLKEGLEQWPYDGTLNDLMFLAELAGGWVFAALASALRNEMMFEGPPILEDIPEDGKIETDTLWAKRRRGISKMVREAFFHDTGGIPEETEKHQDEAVGMPEEMEKDRDEAVEIPEKMEKHRDDTLEIPGEMEKHKHDAVEIPEEMEKHKHDAVGTPEEMEKDRDDTLEIPEEMERDRDDILEIPEEMEKDRDDAIKIPEEMEKHKHDAVEIPEEMEKDRDDALKIPEEMEKEIKRFTEYHFLMGYYDFIDIRIRESSELLKNENIPKELEKDYRKGVFFVSRVVKNTIDTAFNKLTANLGMGLHWLTFKESIEVSAADERIKKVLEGMNDEERPSVSNGRITLYRPYFEGSTTFPEIAFSLFPEFRPGQ
ncbi:MAG: hypothetical protein KAU14_06210, partial [Thermoplasmata archaeon]|nr:hypothetical protein [Thermoplasmata archaeon]